MSKYTVTSGTTRQVTDGLNNNFSELYGEVSTAHPIITNSIADGAVTTGKIATGSITSDKFSTSGTNDMKDWIIAEGSGLSIPINFLNKNNGTASDTQSLDNCQYFITKNGKFKIMGHGQLSSLGTTQYSWTSAATSAIWYYVVDAVKIVYSEINIDGKRISKVDYAHCDAWISNQLTVCQSLCYDTNVQTLLQSSHTGSSDPHILSVAFVIEGQLN